MVTYSYIELQVVSYSYTGLHRVTSGYLQLQRVTSGYLQLHMWLNGITLLKEHCHNKEMELKYKIGKQLSFFYLHSTQVYTKPVFLVFECFIHSDPIGHSFGIPPYYMCCWVVASSGCAW